jgi:hypothetical protein
MEQTLRSDLPAASACHTASDGIELVFRGHGMLGLAQIGVLKAFAQAKLPVKRTTAMSLSTVVAALHCNGVDPSSIEQLFLDPKARRYMRDAWFGHGNCGKQTTDRMQELLPIAKKLVALKKLAPQQALRLMCFDVVENRTVVYEGLHYDLATALAACCSVSGVMRPVRRGLSLLVDCSHHGCKLERPCSAQTIISEVTVDGELPHQALSPVDRWLHDRARFIAPESDCQTIVPDPCPIIATRLPVKSMGGCRLTANTIKRIIDAGYRSASQHLAS